MRTHKSRATGNQYFHFDYSYGIIGSERCSGRSDPDHNSTWEVESWLPLIISQFPLSTTRPSTGSFLGLRLTSSTRWVSAGFGLGMLVVMGMGVPLIEGTTT